jgi:hypothetical protein
LGGRGDADFFLKPFRDDGMKLSQTFMHGSILAGDCPGGRRGRDWP